MPRISTRLLFDQCYSRFAIPAVNVFTMEQIHGLFQAAQKSSTPVIVQLTPAARNYAHPKMLMAMIDAASVIFPDALYSIHLDHGVEDHVFDAIENNYNSVMIDASHDGFEKNIIRTKAVVEIAHKKNIMVEAELGVLSGIEDDIQVLEDHSRYTDPGQAKEFVLRTECDSLAVAVGTSHGAYKFSGGKGLSFEVLEKIQSQLPGFPLVLHGASSVNKSDVAEINFFGGKLKENASGVSDMELQKAIQYGICKVNIATDLRLLWTKVHRKFFKEQPELFDPVIPEKEYMKQFSEFMIRRFEILRCIGKSKLIKV